MRDNYARFASSGATVIAVAQDDAEDVNEYWKEESIPFLCLPDPDSVLKNLFHQESKMGPLPAVFIIDTKGTIQFAHYGTGMKDIPTVEDLLSRIPK